MPSHTVSSCGASTGLLTAFVLSAGATHSYAAYRDIFIAPTSGAGITYGISATQAPGFRVLEGGTAIGRFGAWDITSGKYLGTRVLRWSADGSCAEYQTLGAAADATRDAAATRLWPDGSAVGWSQKYSAAGTDLGPRVVRWNPAGQITELPTPYLLPSGYGSATGGRTNSSGAIAGSATKFGSNSMSIGERAVRWAPDGTPTVLGDLGTASDGYTSSAAGAVADDGTTVGVAVKYVASASMGFRAVRWAPGSTAPTEMGDLGTSSTGQSEVRSGAMNATGTVIGFASRYEQGTFKGKRAVRWLAGETQPTELEHLGTGMDLSNHAGYTETYATDINNAGVAIGSARRYNSPTDNRYVTLAVAWDAAGQVTQLPIPTLNGIPFLETGAGDISESGLIAGSASTTYNVQRAFVWNPDGSILDLTRLVDPRWTLETASAISDDGWVVGRGVYHPVEPTTGYTYTYMLQIPEPAGLSTLAVSGTLLLRRRSRSTSHRPIR